MTKNARKMIPGLGISYRRIGRIARETIGKLLSLIAAALFPPEPQAIPVPVRKPRPHQRGR